MKNLFNKINIFSFILGIIVSGGIVSASTYLFLASDVNYVSSDNSWKKPNGEDIDNVKDAIDILHDTQENYISQLKKQKVIYITASHKKATGYNNLGFNVNLYVDDEYFSYSSNKITVKKACDVIIKVAIVNTAETTSGPIYKLYKNSTNIFSLTNTAGNSDKKFGTVNVSLEQGDTMYAQMNGGSNNFTYYITTITLDN